jgi:hypothetical protein
MKIQDGETRIDAISLVMFQREKIELLKAALVRCIPADDEAARMKHEALLREWP